MPFVEEEVKMYDTKLLLRLWILWRWTEVTVALWDVARWKPAVQSSEYIDAHLEFPLGPHFGVDGDNVTNFHTFCGTLEWWMVDLQGQYSIKQITITNIDDPHAQRFRNFRIEVFRENLWHHQRFTHITGEICATHGDSILPDRTTVFTCPPGIVGRFVRVIWQKWYSECLHLSEINVLVDNVYSKSFSYEVFKEKRTTDSPFLSLTTDDFWTCVTACINRRDTELCTAFNWAPELNQCLLLRIQPFRTANIMTDVKWTLYSMIANF